ncbi:hypothetical protein H4R34_005826 [Dimargaris verticillata]|uniref:Uncharacterized protein n=1 Tax=Dimargaris verticillata TaxID=2761393 RepID=A0A9W8AZU9_9FUNG|nr:hypothetical protein H4R34_005826 [Dimargaris verticillata]
MTYPIDTIHHQVDEKVKTFDSMLQSDMLRGSGEVGFNAHKTTTRRNDDQNTVEFARLTKALKRS